MREASDSIGRERLRRTEDAIGGDARRSQQVASKDWIMRAPSAAEPHMHTVSRIGLCRSDTGSEMRGERGSASAQSDT